MLSSNISMDDLSLTILDIVENSISAQSSLIYVCVWENTLDNTLSIIINDNGTGMDDEDLKKVTDPFYTTKTVRKTGLGLPFFKGIADMCDGTFEIKSEKGAGTKIKAVLKKNHIDRPIIGDIAETVYTVITNQFVKEFIYEHIVDDEKFIFRLSGLEMDYDILINNRIGKEIKEYINYNLSKIKRGE